MKKLFVITLLTSVILLFACSKQGKLTTNDRDGKTSEKITPSELTEALLQDRMEQIYQQTSEDFQAEISLDDFEKQLMAFNQGVESYQLQFEEGCC